MAASVNRVVTGVDRTADTIIAVDGRAADAGIVGTRLETVAEKTVVAVAIGGTDDIGTGIRTLIAELPGAGIRPRLAACGCRTRFGPIAIHAIVATCVILYMNARIGSFVTRIDRTRNRVITVHTGTSNAADISVARLCAIAKQTVVAEPVIGIMHT